MRQAAVFVLLAALLGGCTAFQHAQPKPLPISNSQQLGQLVVYSDFDLPREHRLLRELSSLRERVNGELALPGSDEPVHVYLFKTPRRYNAFLRRHFPEFPERRAFFVETDTRLSVYAYWGDRIAEDVRHEVTHGYLHASVSKIPLWLDEGTAEYFEVESGLNGFHDAHLRLLMEQQAAGSWRPDLSQLERLADIAAMNQIHYAEAWAWVHFLVQSTPERLELLQKYLRDLRERRGDAPLSVVLRQVEPQAEAQLLAHIQQIAGNRR